MSADLRASSDCAANCAQPEALYFDSGNGRLFGWLHRPAPAVTGDIGLVICKPFGYEGICAHRSIAAFAEAAAGLGVPTLRFDYLGAGDSADIDPQADQIEVWKQDIAAAIVELRRRTGVGHVCLLGFRLGALLATLVAAQCEEVDSLVLIAPVVNGRRYLRELRTTRLAASMGAAPQQPVGPSFGVGQAVETSGFLLSAATLGTLGPIDLLKYGAPPVSKILVIDSSSLPAARAWADALLAVGVRTEYQSLPGVVEMLMTDPQFAVVPQLMITTMRDWLSMSLQESAPRPEFASMPSHRGLTKDSPVLDLPGDASSPLALLSERPVFLTSDVLLFGIVTEPRERDKRRRGVILLNVGAEHHIGSSRMYVSLARQWSRHGYTVLRIDLAGLGDSATRPGRPNNEVFPPAAIDDIRTAFEYLRNRHGIEDIALGGLCSGAYHALRAAIAKLPVKRVFLINPMNFLWSESLSADNLQLEVDVARNVGFYRERAFSAHIWKRILTGQLNVWRVLRILLHRPLLNLQSRFNDLARTLRIRLPRDLGWELEELGARGIKMVFIFARGEPGIDVLKLQAGSSLRGLGDRCLIHTIDSADHIFSNSAARDLLENILSKELYARISWSENEGREE